MVSQEVLRSFTLILMFSFPALPHFPCSAIVLIHQETNAERHRGMFLPKNHPSRSEEVWAVLSGLLSPLSLYC
jgi:hypothetical protein